MYGFWRLGLSPFPSAGAAIVSNGLETATSSHVKATPIPREDGRDPDDEVARPPPREPDGERRVRGEDEQPEEQRPLLPTPEGRELVLERQVAARVPRDVREREVVADEPAPPARTDATSVEKNDARARYARSARAGACRARRPPAGDERVDGEPEGDEECRAAEVGHAPRPRSRRPGTSTGTS